MTCLVLQTCCHIDNIDIFVLILVRFSVLALFATAGFGGQFQPELGMFGDSRRPEHHQTSNCGALCWHLVAQGGKLQVCGLKALLSLHPDRFYLRTSRVASPQHRTSTRRRVRNVCLPCGQLRGKPEQTRFQSLGALNGAFQCAEQVYIYICMLYIYISIYRIIRTNRFFWSVHFLPFLPRCCLSNTRSSALHALVFCLRFLLFRVVILPIPSLVLLSAASLRHPAMKRAQTAHERVSQRCRKLSMTDYTIKFERAPSTNQIKSVQTVFPLHIPLPHSFPTGEIWYGIRSSLAQGPPGSAMLCKTWRFLKSCCNML